VEVLVLDVECGSRRTSRLNQLGLLNKEQRDTGWWRVERGRKFSCPLSFC
jgi:hypothetical protein